MASKYDDYWAGRAEELSALVHRFVSGDEATLPVDDLKAVGRRMDWSGFAVISEGQVERAHDVNTRALARWLLAHHPEAFREGRCEVRVTRQLEMRLDRRPSRTQASPAPIDGTTSAPQVPDANNDAQRPSPTPRLPSMLHARSDDVRDLLQDVQGLDQLQRRLDRLTATDTERPVDHDHRQAVAFLDGTGSSTSAVEPTQPAPQAETEHAAPHARPVQADLPTPDGDQDAAAWGPLGEADLYAPLLGRASTRHPRPRPAAASAASPSPSLPDRYANMLPPVSTPGQTPASVASSADWHTRMLPPFSAPEPAPAAAPSSDPLRPDPYRHMVSPWLDADPGRSSHPHRMPAEPAAQTPDPMATVALVPPFAAAMQDLLDGGGSSEAPPEEDDPLHSIVAVIHRMVDVLPVVQPPFDLEVLPEKALYLFHEHGRVFHDVRDHPRITHIGAPRPREAHQEPAESSQANAGGETEAVTAEEFELEWTGEELQGPEQMLVAAPPADPECSKPDAATAIEDPSPTSSARLGGAWSVRVLPIKDDAERQHLATFMIAALTTYEAQEEGAEVDVDAFLAAFPVESQVRLLLQSVRDTVCHMHPPGQTVSVVDETADDVQLAVTDARADAPVAAVEAADHPYHRDDGSVVIPLHPRDQRGTTRPR